MNGMMARANKASEPGEDPFIAKRQALPAMAFVTFRLLVAEVLRLKERCVTASDGSLNRPIAHL
jgi:hypothetical protein